MLNLRRSSLLNRFINLFSMTTVPFRLFSKFFPHMDESLLGKNKNSAKYLQPSFLCPIEIDYISKKERFSGLSAVLFFWKNCRKLEWWSHRRFKFSSPRRTWPNKNKLNKKHFNFNHKKNRAIQSLGLNVLK